MTTQDHTSDLSYADALRIARGCTDYGGGHRGDPVRFEAYQDGIQTVITALTHADPKDSQTRALMAMGAQPQQPAGWRLVPVEPTQEWIDAAGEKGLRIGSIRSLISDVLACAPAHPSQQPAGWMPIETCPLEHGKRFLIAKDCGPGTLASVSVAYRLEGSPDHWWFSDSAKSVERYGYRVTHWAPLSPAPGAHPSQQEDA
ncbi:hypothetical protein CAL14_08275 [Bordetella genomosp. 9]|uniref:hypothetical protein n=1 Tax=Bordetella genomosp. 9 TaxID=1416803 RepID=UPI000A296072|nr:hypothetical protein [Bordetella genomosp. 9]ARP90280.1 hypothetical protein CAL14_08275 [Bordetella genomosp. 9]